MRLWPISDLQLDLNPDIGFMSQDVDADVCVIAGDAFRPLRRSVLAVGVIARRMPVIYVPGNRDFYGCVLEDELEAARAIAGDVGVTLLDDDATVIDGVRFFGATLWTGLKGASDAERNEIRLGLSDLQAIDTRDGRWTLEKQVEAHRYSIHLLKRTLAAPHDGPTVVVSHHAPHPNSTPPRFSGSLMNKAFHSDLTELMESQNAPDLWIHGAMHHNVDYTVGETRVFSNSRGYVMRSYSGPEPENLEYDPACVIEVQERAPALKP